MTGAAPRHPELPRSDTQTARFAAPPDQAFDFIADPENLPRWAVGFCQSIRRDTASDDRWVVTTAHGEVALRYVVDRARGIIDFHLSPAPGVETVAYSRVVPNGGGTEYIFTQVQTPGMPDEQFDAQVEALREELVVLQALLRARAACQA
jgi:hypothetical protein